MDEMAEPSYGMLQYHLPFEGACFPGYSALESQTHQGRHLEVC